MTGESVQGNTVENDLPDTVYRLSRYERVRGPSDAYTTNRSNNFLSKALRSQAVRAQVLRVSNPDLFLT